MPGFLGNFSRIGVKNNFDENHNHSLICESISTNCLYLERRTVDKFLNDKLFHEDEDMIILTEGVILNRLQLIEKFSQINFFLTIKEMFNKLGENSFNELRGSFSGLIFIKKQEELF